MNHPRSFTAGLLLVVFLGSAASCARTEEDRSTSTDQAAARVMLDAIHADFVTRLVRAQEPNSFDARCPYPLREGVVGAYMEAAAKGDFEASATHLLGIYSRMRCVSAARFRDVQVALYEALETARVDKSNVADYEMAYHEVVQVLIPVIFLVFDMGNAPLRQQLEPWLQIKLAEHQRELSDPESILRRIGLWSATDYGLVRLDYSGIESLLTSLASDAFLSGRCNMQSIEWIDVSVGDNEIRVPYCPRDCMTPGEGPAGPVTIRTAEGESDDPVERRCRDLQDVAEQLDDSRRGPRVRQCLERFGDRNRDFMTCLVNASGSRPLAGLDLSSPVQPAREFAVARRCQRTQGGGGRGGRIETQTSINPTEDGGRQWWRRSTHYNADGDVVVTVTIQRSFDADGNITHSQYQVDTGDSTVLVTTQYNEAGEGKSVVQTIQDDGVGDEEPCGDVADCLDTAAGSGAGQAGECGPEQTSCDTGCSLADQMLQDMGECFAASSPEGEGREPGSGPDPRVLMPDPQATGALSSDLAELTQCVLEALGGDTADPVTQTDCQAYLRCPDNEPPHGDSCTCGPDQLYAGGPLRDLCDRMQCDEASTVCPCNGLPDGSDAGEGLPPVGPIPDPAPRLRVLGVVH